MWKKGLILCCAETENRISHNTKRAVNDGASEREIKRAVSNILVYP